MATTPVTLPPSVPVKSVKPSVDLLPLLEMTKEQRAEYLEQQNATWTRHQNRKALDTKSAYLYHETSAIRSVRAKGLQPTQPGWKDVPTTGKGHRWDARADGYLCMATSEDKAKSLGKNPVKLRMKTSDANAYDFRHIDGSNFEVRTTQTIPVDKLEYFDQDESKWKPLQSYPLSTSVEAKPVADPKSEQ